jgi:hypothetical protein
MQVPDELQVQLFKHCITSSGFLLFVGQMLARCGDILIDRFESTKNYETSILLLQYLLCLRVPVLTHHRGHWFNRLCIDLEHMKQAPRSLQIAQYALKDNTIRVSNF